VPLRTLNIRTLNIQRETIVQTLCCRFAIFLPSNLRLFYLIPARFSSNRHVLVLFRTTQSMFVTRIRTIVRLIADIAAQHSVTMSPKFVVINSSSIVSCKAKAIRLSVPDTS